MAWLILLLAGIAETAWAIGLKHTNGFTKPVPTIITVSLMAASFILLAQALKSLPLGTAYAVWVGIGAVGTVIAGMILFEESRDILRILCVMLIITGIAGLKIVEQPKDRVLPTPADLVAETDGTEKEA